MIDRRIDSIRPVLADSDDVAAIPPETRLEGVVRSRRRLKRLRETRDVSLNIVPLVDVTFLLMIFFVLAGTFEFWEGVLSARMPRSAAVAAVPLPISPVAVRLQRGRGGPDEFVVSVDGVARRPADAAELTAILADVQQRPGFDAQTPVLIYADARVRWDHVVNAWNAAVRAKFINVVFADQ